MKLLVFDDEEAIGRTIVRAATQAGFEAVAVTQAEAFVQQLRRDPPHLVMLDLQLGATDGVQQIQTLADMDFAGVLVPMSGFDTRVLDAAGALAQDLGLNVAEVLPKPLSLAELERGLEKVRRAGERLTLKRLLTAIDDDELCLDFQAVVSRNPRQVKRLEALVRWQHPVLGRLPPAEFLPLAESDEAAMNALTDWVVDGTVEAYQVLAELGFSVPLSVNMSMLNLHDSTLPDRLEQRLRQGSMPTRHLHIEVSVSDSFADTSRVSSVLARLRLKGMAMAISGFGSGNASLKLLRQLPFSEVKLDRSFVRDIASSRESQVIVKSVVALCNSLSVDCVAEGVETAASANMLEALGVSQLQGEFIARPMPVEAVSAWIAGFADEPQPSPDNRRVFTGASTGPPPAMASAPETVPGAPRVRLPPRQEQVMQLVAEGCSVKEIARRLGLGPGTVKVHLSLAYSTLGAHNRIEALRNFGALRDPVAHGGNKMDDQGFAQEALSA